VRLTWWLLPEAGIAGVYAPGTPVALGAADTEGVKVGCGMAGACNSSGPKLPHVHLRVICTGVS